jgi:hypothetical protein
VAHAEDENGVTSKAIGDQMIIDKEAVCFIHHPPGGGGPRLITDCEA